MVKMGLDMQQLTGEVGKLPRALAASDLDDSGPVTVADQCRSFSIHHCGFGRIVLNGQEMAPYDASTPLLIKPSYIRGAVRARDAGVPVVDLAMRMEVALTASPCRTRGIVLKVPVDGGRLRAGIPEDANDAALNLRPDPQDLSPVSADLAKSEFMDTARAEGGARITLPAARKHDELSKMNEPG